MDSWNELDNDFIEYESRDETSSMSRSVDSSVDSTPAFVEYYEEYVEERRARPHYNARHGGYEEQQRQNVYMAQDDDDDFDFMVKIERGYAGVCGVQYPYNVGDTYWCDDRQFGLRTHCQVVSNTLHLCCVDTDGCTDLDDMRQWRF